MWVFLFMSQCDLTYFLQSIKMNFNVIYLLFVIASFHHLNIFSNVLSLDLEHDFETR